ncbi:hypothetical protein CAN33_0050855 [Aspergillus niger]|uniref:Uncharacterized protein n=1 Tax=Aspergillus niger TaxID=5061 RepID=A0A505IEZ6_ASPNG|nr:hypothetical protein CAN33_0050855 [Aspergillus niger]GJP94606.1 hypothetical protein AlacWU_07505 [Aspergillus niger]
MEILRDAVPFHMPQSMNAMRGLPHNDLGTYRTNGISTASSEAWTKTDKPLLASQATERYLSQQ